MPDIVPDVEVTEEAPVVETPTTPPPEYVSKADFDRVVVDNAARHEAAMSEMRSLVSTLARAPREPQAAPQGDLSDEQLQAAVDEGRMSSAAMISAITRRENRKFAAEQIEPLRNAGLANISELSKAVAASSLREDGKAAFPYAKRYSKEIDDILAAHIKGGNVVNPAVYAEAYRYVVGGHIDELTGEAQTASVRNANPAAPERTGSGARTGRTTTSSPTLTVESVLGDGAARALDAKMRQRGWTEDQAAQAMGYKSMSDYLKQAQEAAN